MTPLNSLIHSAQPTPPPPPQRPYSLEGLDGVRTDAFYWLQDDEDPQTQAYIESEQSYASRVDVALAPLQDAIVAEFTDRIIEPYDTYPVTHGGYEYFSHITPDKPYPVHLRRPVGGGDSEVVLDENTLTTGESYLSLSGLVVSDDHSRIVYGVDHTGGERFTLTVADIHKGTIQVRDEIPNTTYGFALSIDGDNLIYTRPDDAMRPHEILCHRVGSDPSTDSILFQEPDERFYLDVGRTKDHAYITIVAESKTSSEWWLIDANDPLAPSHCVHPREPDLEYHIDHAADGFYIMANPNRDEFGLFHASTIEDPWREIEVIHDDERLEGFELTTSGLGIATRTNGVLAISFIPNGATERIPFSPVDEPCTAWASGNIDIDSPTFRYEITSLALPHRLYEVDLATFSQRLLWQQPVGGGVDPETYTTVRTVATSPDKTQVPVTLVYRNDLASTGGHPTLVYGYGAYEESIDPSFSILRLSLLDRGFVYAIAHVRGGGEFGRSWYDGGRRANKVNSFIDLEAVVDHLVRTGYSDPTKIVLRGASAGGLLIAATVNRDPSKYRAAILEVPFVDCLTTISDPTLPLTVTEWDEWGDPCTDLAIAQLMASYSPYDNLQPTTYPDLFVTTGLNDVRVGYWEPLKYVAKIRSISPTTHIVLRVDTDSGHMGPSERHAAWKDEARVLAFIIAATSDTSPNAYDEEVPATKSKL
ncbi:MAG: S9 family peptidase [Ferrimicrobium sp.]